MKLLSASAALAIALAGIAACTPRHPRHDWRSPATRAPCASDGDCPNGTCAIELGASQGTCAPASPQPLPGSDGGTRPTPAPGLNVQPSPNDIQL